LLAKNNMASTVLSGASNPTYVNSTGQNVRLLINYMSNVTRMSWSGVSISNASTTIGKDIQNIYGEFRYAIPQGHNQASPNTIHSGQAVPGSRVTMTYFPYTNAYHPPHFSSTNTGNPDSHPITSNSRYWWGWYHWWWGFNSWWGEGSNIFYIPLSISRGGNFPTEIMLANGDLFSATSGAYNIIIIKEDGT
jgi:hypothetical protein